MLYWVLKYLVIGPWLWLFYRPKVEGLENIPSTGPAILASNHLSFCDSVFLPLVVNRRVTFVAKSEYFTGKGLKGAISRWFFTAVGQVPMDRSGGQAAQAALNTAVRMLDEGELFGIYPEGTRSPDGRLYKGKTGVARIALLSGAPVIPCAMMNTHILQPPGKLVPKIGRIYIRIGKPLNFSRYDGLVGDRFVERSIADEIMYELMDLSGQEYVDIYASKLKNAPQSTPAKPANPVKPATV